MMSTDLLDSFLSSLSSRAGDWDVIQVLPPDSCTLEAWVYILVPWDDDIVVSVESGQVILHIIQLEWSGKVEIRTAGVWVKAEVRTLVCAPVSGVTESRVVWILESNSGEFEHTMLVLVPDSARISAHAVAEVRPNVQGYIVSIHETAIMLADSWSVRGIPELRIASDGGTASHSATVERISENMLAYMESRGIPEPQARGIYVRSRIDSEFSRIPLESRDILFSELSTLLKI